ncbi:MAG: zinc ribbon domain-containing protein [Clostridia bacterium]|nr:zinc ribbon domain-containing protein [Clostridia bacterium]
MSYFELLQESPGLFFVAILVSLIVTVLVYGAFPIIFAKVRKASITKKKYKCLCFGINFIGMVFFVALNGVSSGGPYLLWTWFFSSYGSKILETQGLLLEENQPTQEPVEQNQKICFCRQCGTGLSHGSRFCRKCGTKVIDEEKKEIDYDNN